MENGIDRGGGPTAIRASRAWARDVLGALAVVEGAIAQRVLTDVAELVVATRNVFGDEVTLERADTSGDASAYVAALLHRAGERTAAGERVALVVSARGLACARGAMRALVAKRVGVVAHAISDVADSDVHGGNADALSLADLGWGVLFASSVGESVDLALVARRAAEDSGNPFVVVHERSRVRHVEPVPPMSRELCEAFVGAPLSRVTHANAAHAPTPREPNDGARAFAERVPFALGSAMRELEALTGRRHDVFERAPAADAAVALVGLGTVGDSLIAEVERLRAAGHDVSAVKIVALRPFPGARLVKALSRALAITVIEDVDVPLAQSNPLTAEIKASFTDALTWAPDYPGIGRMPRILSGVSGVAGHELEARDLDAVVHNMLADERGRRAFVLGGDHLAPAVEGPVAPLQAAAPFSMRGVVVDAETATSCADLCVAVVASALGLRARASVRPLKSDEGSGFAFDLVAGKDRPRGAHAPHAAKLIALSDLAALGSANPLRRLAQGGIVAIPSGHRSADGVWSEVPTWVKALVHDRGARVIGYDPHDTRSTRDVAGAARWITAAAYAGLALAGASSSATGFGGHGIDPSLVAREVGEALRAALEGSADLADGSAMNASSSVTLATLATEAGDVARRAFEAHVEVPRATVERDEEGVRLGRKDARASSPPR